ncbi:hypothetical protein JW935_10965 [candidate division KSB1 bacterium]|nr:hypothetical protein [candidate division KSB1 bacterium]
MMKINQNYLAILSIEVQDLQMDIQELIKHCEDENANGHLTSHVFMENLALFNNELLGVQTFQKIITQTNPEAFVNLDDMIRYLQYNFQEKIETCGLAKAISYYVDRKLVKVRRYVTEKIN